MDTNFTAGKKTISDIDNNFSSTENKNEWHIFDGKAGHWWMIDLEKECYIKDIEINWSRKIIQVYTLELSLDNTNWIFVSGNQEQ